jgi:hypothetical protein
MPRPLHGLQLDILLLAGAVAAGDGIPAIANGRISAA